MAQQLVLTYNPILSLYDLRTSKEIEVGEFAKRRWNNYFPETDIRRAWCARAYDTSKSKKGASTRQKFALFGRKPQSAR